MVLVLIVKGNYFKGKSYVCALSLCGSHIYNVALPLKKETSSDYRLALSVKTALMLYNAVLQSCVLFGKAACKHNDNL